MEYIAITPDSNHAGVKRFRGFSIKEDSSAAATVELKTSSSGTVVMYLSFTADEHKNLILDKDAAMVFPDGCYVNEATGSITGTLFFD